MTTTLNVDNAEQVIRDVDVWGNTLWAMGYAARLTVVDVDETDPDVAADAQSWQDTHDETATQRQRQRDAWSRPLVEHSDFEEHREQMEALIAVIDGWGEGMWTAGWHAAVAGAEPHALKKWQDTQVDPHRPLWAAAIRALGKDETGDDDNARPKRVQRRRAAGSRTPPSRYVGRLGPRADGAGDRNKFANPHTVEEFDGDHVAAAGAYRRHLRARPDLVAAARSELAGRDLSCWCRPDQACHADVLLDVASGADP